MASGDSNPPANRRSIVNHFKLRIELRTPTQGNLGIEPSTDHYSPVNRAGLEPAINSLSFSAEVTSIAFTISPPIRFASLTIICLSRFILYPKTFLS